MKGLTVFIYKRMYNTFIYIYIYMMCFFLSLCVPDLSFCLIYKYIFITLEDHRLVYRLGQLISLIYGRGTRIPRGAQQLDPQRQLSPVQDFSPLCLRSFLQDFLLLSHYSCVRCFLLLHPCCSHARYHVWDTHLVHRIPVLYIVHAEWSLVF